MLSSPDSVHFLLKSLHISPGSSITFAGEAAFLRFLFGVGIIRLFVQQDSNQCRPYKENTGQK